MIGETIIEICGLLFALTLGGMFVGALGWSLYRSLKVSPVEFLVKTVVIVWFFAFFVGVVLEVLGI